MKVGDIEKRLDEVFPTYLAESWDNVGLLLGDTEARAEKVMVALELTPGVVDAALGDGCDLVVTHHPPIFKAIKRLTTKDMRGGLLWKLACRGVSVITAHTNCDAASGSIRDLLAKRLHLSSVGILLPSESDYAVKIVSFVPEADAERVASAMHEAGAGVVGAYEKVSFRSRGVGYFTCGSTSNPTIGEPGSSETVEEVKVECVARARDVNKIMAALTKAHPYEEPATDVFRLENGIDGMTDIHGIGLIGLLERDCDAVSLARLIKEKLEIPDAFALRYTDPGVKIRKIAIINGSGAKFVREARSAGAQALITSDCGHHDFEQALSENFVLMDAGHYQTEKFIVDLLAQSIDTEGVNVIKYKGNGEVIRCL